MSSLFYLNKQQVKRSFSQAALTYDSVTQLQRSVGNAMLRHATPCMTGTVVDLGCGTGFFTAGLLTQVSCQRMIALDIASPMLHATRNRLSSVNHMAYLCADAEKLPFVKQSVDTVFSNLMLQWCVNLEAVFNEIYRVLKPDGQLVFSIFGPKTLQELKQAWAEVDAYSHVNYFYGLSELETFLQQSGFEIVDRDQRLYETYYDSVWSLMRELKAIGAQTVNSERNKHLTTKGQMSNMIAAYPVHRQVNKILATFDVITLVARYSGK